MRKTRTVFIIALMVSTVLADAADFPVPKRKGNCCAADVRPTKSPLTSLTDALHITPSTYACTGRRSTMTIYNVNAATYRSKKEKRREGGRLNRYMEPANSVEAAIENGRPITLATDIYGTFGGRCNPKYNPTRKSCTLLVRYPGFDKKYPEYRKKFPQLPADSFVGITEDTGEAFYHTEHTRLDLPVRSRSFSYDGGAKPVYFAEIKNPCGSTGIKPRLCNLTELRITDQCAPTRESASN